MSTPIAEAIAELEARSEQKFVEYVHVATNRTAIDVLVSVQSREVVSEEVQALIQGAKHPCLFTGMLTRGTCGMTVASEYNPQLMCWPCGARHVLEAK